MNVVLTAPIPGVNIPSFPFAGAIFVGRCILFPLSNSLIVLLQSGISPCSLSFPFASAVKSSESFLSFFPFERANYARLPGVLQCSCPPFLPESCQDLRAKVES
jgi:hypothetical protein